MRVASRLWLVVWLLSASLSAQVRPAEPIADLDIIKRYQTMARALGFSASQAQKALWLSQSFLGTPYAFTQMCGDGAQAKYQRAPLASFEAFNCVTFVETVLALSFTPLQAKDFTWPWWLSLPQRFYDQLIDIKYHGEVSFNERNHFVSLDWLPHQVAQGRLQDITQEVFSNYSLRRVYISKAQWYQSKTIDDIWREDLSHSEKTQLLAELKDEGEQWQDQWGEMPYIALADLMDPNLTLLEKAFEIAQADIVLFNLIRSDHRKTHIPVVTSHQGFLVRLPSGIFFRHAGTMKNIQGVAYPQAVVDVPALDYLNELSLSRSWPVLGFNFNEIVR